MPEPEVLINTRHLIHNVATLLKSASPRKVFPVIKANAYGHGIFNIAHLLENKFSEVEIPLLCVARLEEALQLRRVGIRRRILVMSYFDASGFMTSGIPCDELDLVVHDFSKFELAIKLLSEKKNLKCGLHININSGMNRLGFSHENWSEYLETLMGYIARAYELQIPVTGIMTHFARGEEVVQNFSALQLDRFCDCVRKIKIRWDKNIHGDFPSWIHAENSGAMARGVGELSSMLTATRPGLHVWGTGEDEFLLNELGYKAVMQVRAPVVQVFKVKKGETIGYGAAYRCVRDTLVGTVALGYGDGLPRVFSRSESDPPAQVGLMLEGRRVQIVGRVSMDLTCIDLTDHPRAAEWAASIGTSLHPEIWAYWIGDGQSVKDIAREMKTIDYEIFCMVATRLNRREVS